MARLGCPPTPTTYIHQTAHGRCVACRERGVHRYILHLDFVWVGPEPVSSSHGKGEAGSGIGGMCICHIYEGENPPLERAIHKPKSPSYHSQKETNAGFVHNSTQRLPTPRCLAQHRNRSRAGDYGLKPARFLKPNVVSFPTPNCCLVCLGLEVHFPSRHHLDFPTTFVFSQLNIIYAFIYRI